MNKNLGTDISNDLIFSSFDAERRQFQELSDSIWDSKIIGIGQHEVLDTYIKKSVAFIISISIENVTPEVLDAIKKLNQGMLSLQQSWYYPGEIITYLYLVFHTFLVAVGLLDRTDFTNPYGFRVSELMGLHQ